MIVSKYFVWFIIYSFMGWIYESTYCTIRKHHWENRGFLHGPIVPIYGVGALLASILFSELPISGLQEAGNLKIILICFFGSIVLEYTTSWGLEKLFHAYWWDYSDVFCNINGRVCLPASIGFGCAGILVVRVIYPFVNGMTHNTNPYLMEGLALAFMFVFGMDMALKAPLKSPNKSRKVLLSARNSQKKRQPHFATASQKNVWRICSYPPLLLKRVHFLVYKDLNAANRAMNYASACVT